MTNEPTTPTKYGPACYSVTPDGCLSLSWEGVTINRVPYRSAHAFEQRNRYSDHKAPNVYAHREDGKDASSAALAGFRDELRRLAAELVTPEAMARARAEEARREMARRARATQEAQDAEAQARAALAEALAALLLFEPLRAERLDELENGAA